MKVVVVGLGRVGGAIALGLRAAKWNVSVATRDPKKARALKLGVATAKQLKAAELCVLAVPDAQVADAAAAAVKSLGPQTVLVHCAGALKLDAFRQPKRRRASFHPLVAISDPRDELTGCFAAIAATDHALLRVLRDLAKALKMHVLEVAEAKRARYHAGAVMSAGLVMALLDAAVDATDLPRSIAEPALLALTASAIRGAKARGVKASLTGPIVRGDVEVVKRHLEALPQELKPLYKALSLRMLELSSGDAALRALLDRPRA